MGAFQVVKDPTGATEFWNYGRKGVKKGWFARPRQPVDFKLVEPGAPDGGEGALAGAALGGLFGGAAGALIGAAAFGGAVWFQLTLDDGTVLLCRSGKLEYPTVSKHLYRLVARQQAIRTAALIHGGH